MPAPSPGLFAVGNLEMFAVELNDTVTRFRTVEGYFAYLTDKGTGFFSKGLAAALVIHIKGAINSAGASIGETYDDYSEAYKEDLGKLGRTPTFFKLTGTLYSRIKVINRRYEGGRGTVAGINDRDSVTSYGWGSKGHRSVKISDYLKALTYGTDSMPARPVIPQAIEHFISTMHSDMVNHFWNKKVSDWDKGISEDRKRFGGTLPSLAPSHISAGDTGAYVSAGDLKGMQVGGAGNKKQDFKNDNADMVKAAIAAGMSAKEAAMLVEEMKKL